VDHHSVIQKIRQQSPADWPLTYILFDPKVICGVSPDDWHSAECGQAVWYTHRPTGLVFTIVILAVDGEREIAATCINACNHARAAIGLLAQEIIRVALADFYASDCT
jgi:hypothetical protein